MSSLDEWPRCRETVDRIDQAILGLERASCRNQLLIIRQLCQSLAESVEIITRFHKVSVDNSRVSNHPMVANIPKLQMLFDSIEDLILDIRSFEPSELRSKWEAATAPIVDRRQDLLHWLGPLFQTDDLNWEKARSEDFEVVATFSDPSEAPTYTPPVRIGLSIPPRNRRNSIPELTIESESPPDRNTLHLREVDESVQHELRSSVSWIDSPSGSEHSFNSRFDETMGSPTGNKSPTFKTRFLTALSMNRNSPGPSFDPGYFSGDSPTRGDTAHLIRKTPKQTRTSFLSARGLVNRSSSLTFNIPPKPKSPKPGENPRHTYHPQDTTRNLLVQSLTTFVSEEKMLVSDSTATAVINHLIHATSEPQPLIPVERLDEFIETVFASHILLRERHRELISKFPENLEALLDDGKLPALFVNHAEALEPLYVTNGEPLWKAYLLVKSEAEVNPNFEKFFKGHVLSKELTVQIRLKEYFLRPLRRISSYVKLLEVAVKYARNHHSNEQVAVKRALESVHKLVNGTKLLAWQVTLGGDDALSLSWNELVTDSRFISNTESQRQSAIFDFIKGEMNWVRILSIFEPVFVRPIEVASPAILDEGKLNKFLGNICQIPLHILDRHKASLKPLLALQRKEMAMIHNLINPSSLSQFEWSRTYETFYATKVVEALEWLKAETAANEGFEQFLYSATFHPRNRYTILDYLLSPLQYLSKSITRLQRILDVTPDGHEDSLYIPLILQKMEFAFDACRKAMPDSVAHTKLIRLCGQLQWSRPGQEVDVSLDHPSRNLVHQGDGWIIDNTQHRSQLHPVHILLFDNYLLLATEVWKKEVLRYHVLPKPIPLILLDRDAMAGRNEVDRTYVNPDGSNSLLAPVMLGRKDKERGLVFLVRSTQDAAKWREMLTEAITKRVRTVEERPELFVLKQMHVSFRKTLCSLGVPSDEPVVLQSRQGEQGIWVIRPTSLPQPSLSVSNVTQMGTVGNFLVTLANGRVTVFLLEHVLAGIKSPPCHELSDKDITFVRSYKKDAVVLHRLVGETSQFIFYRPGGQAKRRSIASRVHYLERYDHFNFPVPCHDIVFRRTRMLLLARDGFHITTIGVNTPGLVTMSNGVGDSPIPLTQDPRAAETWKVPHNLPLAIITTSNAKGKPDMLLCYQKMGIFIDDSWKATGRSLEWLSNSVECIIAFPPYILVISARLVEVRHASTGQLMQLIPSANQVRLSWDGRDVGKDEINCVHAVSRQADASGWEISELVPGNVKPS